MSVLKHFIRKIKKWFCILLKLCVSYFKENKTEQFIIFQLLLYYCLRMFYSMFVQSNQGCRNITIYHLLQPSI